MKKVIIAFSALALLCSSCTETYSGQAGFEAPEIHTTAVCDTTAVSTPVATAQPQAQTYVQQYSYQSAAPVQAPKEVKHSTGSLIGEILEVCFSTIVALMIIFFTLAASVVIWHKFFEIIDGK
jgi:hypothetical protein